MDYQVKLKICGITSYEDACAAIEAGADFLGFNFYPPSPRFIAPEQAREIIERISGDVIPVGVFVNESSPDAVLQKMSESGVEIAQLHGDENDSYCRRVGPAHVIKVLRPGKHFDLDSLIGYPASAFLVDTFDKHLFGGTGKTSNWELAAEIAKNASLFLAGGLSPENIGDAIREVQPYAVDVNSGVEIYPGRKDKAKLQALRFAMKI